MEDDESETFPDALYGRIGPEELVRAITDYAIYLLDREGRIASWNEGARRIKGYTQQEVLGKHFSCFYTPEDRARGLPEYGLQVALKEGSFHNEAWRVRKDGEWFWASVAIDPIYDKDKRVVGFAKVTRDITQHKAAQERSERKREALHHAQKLEAIGRLTGSVAHDFNNLLAIIRTAAEMLESTARLTPAKRRRYVGMISDTASRAARLIDQLLTFSSRQPLFPQVFSPVERIDSMQSMIETSLGPRVKLSLSLPADLPTVLADASQFETAILNLTINARDAMPEGGQVAIRAYQTIVDWLPDEDEVNGRDVVAIIVADTGTGMDSSVLQRVFEPFFTTKPSDQGTGLGLSQVYGFARQSGGDVLIDSELGKGTSVMMFLPQAGGKRSHGWEGILSPLGQQTLKEHE